MRAARRLISLSLLVLSLSLQSSAAEAPITPKGLETPAPTVTVSATPAGVRFATPNRVARLKLEVLSGRGEELFEVSSKGSVLDWSLQDGQGGRLAEGSYVCVLTVEDVSGQITQRLTLLELAGEGVRARALWAADLTTQQSEGVGPFEVEAATVIGARETPDATLLVHDGVEGQLVTTEGDLSFRGGEFFAGTDLELMRLGADGSLTVTGPITAGAGVRFPDGTTLESATGLTTGGSKGPKNSSDDPMSLTSTPNRLAKFTDAAGTLADSVVTESGGNIGIGVAFPAQALHVFGKAHFQNTGTAGVFIVNRTDGKIAAIGAGGVSSTMAYDESGIFKIESNSRASIAAGVFGSATGATTRMMIDGEGRIGAGTETPSFRLHLVDPSNAGLRVQTDTAGGSVASFGGLGDFQIDAPNVAGGRLAVKEGGRVGIGTNSPLAALDLKGGADSDGGLDPVAMAFQYREGGYRHWIRTRHNSVLGSGNAIDFYVNDSATPNGSTGPGLGSGSAHVMTLDSGRVGIGTPTPSEKLTVEGKVQSTSGGFKFPDGSVQTTAANATYTVSRTEDDAAFLMSWTYNDGPLLSLNLPAGTYLLTATVSLYNAANAVGENNNRTVDCTIYGDGLRNYTTSIPGITYAAMTIHSVLTVPSGNTGVLCRSYPSGINTVYAFARRLTAVKIESPLTVQ